MILSLVGWEANTRLLGYIVQELYKALISFSAFLPWIPKVVRGYFSYNCFLFGIFKPRECSRMSLWVNKEIERKGLEILCERKHLQNIHDWLSLDGAVKKQPYNYKHWSYFELLNLHKAWIYVHMTLPSGQCHMHLCISSTFRTCHFDFILWWTHYQ